MTAPALFINEELEAEVSKWWQTHAERNARIVDVNQPVTPLVRLTTKANPPAQHDAILKEVATKPIENVIENMAPEIQARNHDRSTEASSERMSGVWGGWGGFGAVGTIGGSNRVVGELGRGQGRLQRGFDEW
jgi:hypothetical protein